MRRHSDTDAKPITRASVTRLIKQSQLLKNNISDALSAPQKALEAARDAYHQAQNNYIERMLSATSVNRLQDIAGGKLRIGLLEGRGLKSVGDVIRAGVNGISDIRGISENTAIQIVEVAKQLRRAIENEAVLKLDLENQNPSDTNFLIKLQYFVDTKNVVEPIQDHLHKLSLRFDELIDKARPRESWFKTILMSREKRAQSEESIRTIKALIYSEGLATLFSKVQGALSTEGYTKPSVWSRYEKDAARYNTIIEAYIHRPSASGTHGYATEVLVDEITNIKLNLSFMKTSLRGYQAFGAKFAIHQQRVIIGDEMGLGKTLQALAVIAHHCADGKRQHHLVVCPASVIENWVRETHTHTDLKAIKLHGQEKIYGYRKWMTEGGIGVTTYDALKTMALPDDFGSSSFQVGRW